MNQISLNELCKELSISVATGKNWIKLGKLTPEYTDNNTPFFTESYIEQLKTELLSGENNALKSRRNKKYISGNSLYNSYVSEQCQNIESLKKLLAMLSNKNIEPDASIIQLFVAECALHLFCDKLNLPYAKMNNLLMHFLNGVLSVGEYDELINSLIDNPAEALAFCKANPLLFSIDYIYESQEDILGLIYISCQNIGSRKAVGSYYTPTRVVKNLIGMLDIKEGDRVLDPCCGTGNFLLQLPKCVSFDNVYGNDLDAISARIARINIALRYNVPVDIIYEHITERNYLTSYPTAINPAAEQSAVEQSAVEQSATEQSATEQSATEQSATHNFAGYKYIIGNPPWGYDFSKEEKVQLKDIFKATSGENIESYDVFIEQAIRCLDRDGHLAYVLPEAILNVKAHTDIRNIILQSGSIKNLSFLGNAFDGVQCPCIILDLQYTGSPLSTLGLRVSTTDSKTSVATKANSKAASSKANTTSAISEYSFVINTEREVAADNFSFTTPDEEYLILKKIRNIPNKTYLAGNADFALGIVTGNNKEKITTEKTADNEMILKGADICKYHINPSSNYIVFDPENFQQVAPTKMYRAKEKLLYRFISNRFIFAYDDKQTLSLNSCNIVIPNIPDVKIKFVLAILNSRAAQFIFKREFNSVKVLRAHIESIPIPMVDEATQDRIIAVTDRLISGLDFEEAEHVYEELDDMVSELYGLTSDETEIIRSVVDSDSSFLT